MKKKIIMLTVLLAIMLSITCGFAFAEAIQESPAQTAARAEQNVRAKYIFLFIGDGTSIPQINATEMYLAGLDAPVNLTNALAREEGKFPSGNGVADFTPAIKRLVFSGFPAHGISTTYSANSLITDSSSSATAISTGNKTRDGVVGMDAAAQKPFTSIAKQLQAKGYKVGVVSTVSLDHATPAAFYANEVHRNNYYNIALQAASSGYDFFGGGGFLAELSKNKNGGSNPKDGVDYTKDIMSVFAEAGYTVHRDRARFDSIKNGDTKVLAINPVLDSAQAIPYRIDQERSDASGGPKQIHFEEFVGKAIETLDNPNGFFLMSECGKIDWACHANDAVAVINDVQTMDLAVREALKFYEKHPDETLIVITGDHETGGMTLGFAGTHYDAFLKKLQNQKGSFDAFNAIIAEQKKANPNITLADFMPTISDFFGLYRYSADEYAALDAQAKQGDAAAFEKIGMALKDYEYADIEKAFAETFTSDMATASSTDEGYLLYGGYEPLTVTLTHIMGEKAGISFTTYSHTGLPTPVFAIGAGAEQFDGWYDNTDIYKKMAAISGVDK
ncbi:MAG: alkaline phosphatase [Spirochaetaceae bacterium]|jgi:alkaline phosphatase|nr:alkaline phosphatase [Spirochaetaceae bacterium]